MRDMRFVLSGFTLCATTRVVLRHSALSLLVFSTALWRPRETYALVIHYA